MAPSIPNKQEHRGKSPEHILKAEHTHCTTSKDNFTQPDKNKQSKVVPSIENQMAGPQAPFVYNAVSPSSIFSGCRLKHVSGIFDGGFDGAFDDCENTFPGSSSHNKSIAPSSVLVPRTVLQHPSDHTGQRSQAPSPEDTPSATVMDMRSERSLLPSAETKRLSNPKKVRKHSIRDAPMVTPLVPKLNLVNMPAEIQQMIWSHVIMTPACHTFKVVPDQEVANGSWSISLQPNGPARHDTAAYRVWKHYLGLKNSGFQATFRLTVKSKTPITLRVAGSSQRTKMEKKFAVIDQAQDLVIMEFDRNVKKPYHFTWFENTGFVNGLDVANARELLAPFRKVGIVWANKHCRCGAFGGATGVLPAPFYCYCHTIGPHHHWAFKACPAELAFFLDLFPNLEQFYFVVEPVGQAQRTWTAAYRDKVIEEGFEAKMAVPRANPNDPLPEGEKQTLTRFFDAKYEYMQQAQTAQLNNWDMKSPWAEGEGSAVECVKETLEHYKSKKGHGAFCQALEKRKKVRFSIAIRTPLAKNRMITTPAKPRQASKSAKSKEPAQAAPPAQPVRQRASTGRGSFLFGINRVP